MATMTSPQRAEVHAEVMRDLSRETEPCSCNKPNLRAALDAIDQWVSDNAAAFNSAIPLPARTQLTASQKARLLMVVVGKRFKVGV